jgi:hypothetical protein
MTKRESKKALRLAESKWIFPWRRLGEPVVPKVLAFLLAGVMFALVLTSVNVRVTSPIEWAPHRGSVIQVLDDEEGRALTQRAREGGPFPSRFEPSEWQGALALERAALEGARPVATPYVPALRVLPEKGLSQPALLAEKGESVLPKRTSTVTTAPAIGKIDAVPVLQPLSGIQSSAMPTELPPYEGMVDAKMTVEPWRFLIRLDAGGNVQDCVSLAGGDEAGPSTVEHWLRRVVFSPEPEKAPRWIAVAVGFANQPADGPDTH